MKLTRVNIAAARNLRSEFLTWDKIDEVLKNEFEKYSKNDEKNIIAYKVELIDKLYNCNLRMDKERIAEFLKGLNLDEKFETRLDLTSHIKGIANKKLPNYKKRIGFVFASKYCHFSRPGDFPIFDRYAVKALSYLKNAKQVSYHGDYAKYKKDIDELKGSLGLESYKDIDVYLWLYGQWLFYEQRKEKGLKNKELEKGFSREIIKLFKNREKLFKKLEPVK